MSDVLWGVMSESWVAGTEAAQTKIADDATFYALEALDPEVYHRPYQRWQGPQQTEFERVMKQWVFSEWVGVWEWRK